MHDMANLLQRQIFQLSPERDTADFLSSGRLLEVKAMENFKEPSLKVLVYERWPGRLGEVVAYKRF